MGRHTVACLGRTRLRHAIYYQALLARCQRMYLQVGNGPQRAHALVNSEWGNIRIGLAWSEENADTDEGAADLCLAYAEAGADILRQRLRAQEVVHYLTTALRLARLKKNRPVEAKLLTSLGHGHLGLGDAETAAAFYEQALHARRTLGDQRGEARALGNLGIACRKLGDARRAIKYFQQSSTIARGLGDQRTVAVALGNLGLAYADLGNWRKAVELHSRRIAIAREMRDKLGQSSALVPHQARLFGLEDENKLEMPDPYG